MISNNFKINLLIILFLVIFNIDNCKVFLNLKRSNTTEPFLMVKTNNLGDYITDKKGSALYVFQNDLPNKSTCKDDCEKKWIPFLAEDVTFPPPVDKKLDSNLVGLIRRNGGKYQVTYKKMPLYKYKLDTNENDTKGHRKKEFEGFWSLLKPDAVPLDSRLSTNLYNFSGVKNFEVTATGLASILLAPDVFVVKVNITQTGNNLPQSILDLQSHVDLFNTTIQKAQNNTKLVLLDKNINNTDSNFVLTQGLEIYAEDYNTVLNILKKLNEIKEVDSNTLKFTVNYGISDNALSNARSIIYANVVNDAKTNADILLKSFGVEVDPESSIRSISMEKSDAEVDINMLKAKNLKAQMMQIKAIVTFNTRKR